MSYLLTLVSRYSYARIAGRFNVSATYLRAITSGVRAPTPRIIRLSQNLYRSSMYNRLKSTGVNAAQAAKWKSRSLDFIDGMVKRYNILTREIAEQRNTSMAAIRRSLVESDYNIDELEESYKALA